MEYKNYINGRWVPSSNGKTFQSLNPATEKNIGTFQLSTRDSVKHAIDSAESALNKWSDMPVPSRAKYLFKIADLLSKDKERLAKIMTSEMGKVLKEARGDVQESIDIFEYMAGEGRRFFGRTTTSELPDKFCMTIRRPLGVVGVITPWNFPIAIPAWKISTALISGNTIVFKPSSDTPLCATELIKILEKSELPKGVVNMVTGSGTDVGSEIIKSRKVRGVSFTGSRETGEWIMKNAGLKKVGLELGGKNPIIIMDDADINLAVEGILWGAFGTTGQRCTAASRVIVHSKVKKKLENALVKRTNNLRLGNGLDNKTDVGPLINKKAQEKTKKYVETGKKEGRLLCGGFAPKRKGFFFKPTIFTNVSHKSAIAQEEIFGPVLSIIEFKNLEDAINKANDIEYGLSSAIYTKDIRNAFKAMEKLEAGITYINSSTIGAEVHLPFGGVKGTGSTREAGWSGIEEFSEEKAVYVDYSGKLQKAQIDIQ